MNAQEFCYWLQGYFEIAGTTKLTPEQTAMIQKHLQLVFTNVTQIERLCDAMPDLLPRPKLPIKPRTYC